MSRPHRGHRSLRRRGRLRRATGVAGTDPRHGRTAVGRLHHQTAAVRSTAAFAPTLLRADGGQAAGGTPLSGVRLCPQGRDHSSPVAALQRPIQGCRLRHENIPAAGWRARGDRVHRQPQAAPGGRPRPASAAASQRPASCWLISSSHPLPQGLVLARGPVAAQMYVYSYTENPPNCVGGIRELILCLLIVSLVLALLLNTSRSCTLLRIICLVSTVPLNEPAHNWGRVLR